MGNLLKRRVTVGLFYKIGKSRDMDVEPGRDFLAEHMSSQLNEGGNGMTR